MITVTIHLGGFLADLNSSPTVEMPVPPGTGLREVLVELGQQSAPRLHKAILWPDGSPDPSLMVSLDRRVIPPPKLADTAVEKDCRIDLVPLVAGG